MDGVRCEGDMVMTAVDERIEEGFWLLVEVKREGEEDNVSSLSFLFFGVREWFVGWVFE